jgi:hypothetical protein
MALVAAAGEGLTSTDKGINTGVGTTFTVFYTVPTGRKFIGNALIPPGSGIKVGSVFYSPGSGSSAVFPLYLSAGQSVVGYVVTISGVESDA